jgi:hypothetical protein
MPGLGAMTCIVCAVLALCLGLVVGCANPGDPNLSPPADASPGDALPASCAPPQFTYATFGRAFLTKYCNACHGFTQRDMQASPNIFIDVAVTSRYMPLSSTVPTSAERTDLGDWLTCGAP